MVVALVNGRVLEEDGLVEGRGVLIEGGRIIDVMPESDPRCRARSDTTWVATCCCPDSSIPR